MLECYELGSGTSDIRLVLNYQERQRSRYRAKTLCGVGATSPSVSRDAKSSRGP